MKDNIVKFPVKPRVLHMQNQLEEKYHQEQIDQDNAVDMSRFLLDIITTALREQEWVPEYSKMDFTDVDAIETKDMSVVLNCITAMLLRYKGYKHFLDEEMDYIRLMLLEISAQYSHDDDDLDDEWDDE